MVLKKTIFGMITVLLDVRIVNVFVFTAIRVPLNNTRVFGRRVNSFSANKVTAPKVLRCPYAYVSCLSYFWFNEATL